MEHDDGNDYQYSIVLNQLCSTISLAGSSRITLATIQKCIIACQEKDMRFKADVITLISWICLDGNTTQSVYEVMPSFGLSEGRQDGKRAQCSLELENGRVEVILGWGSSYWFLSYIRLSQPFHKLNCTLANPVQLELSS